MHLLFATKTLFYIYIYFFYKTLIWTRNSTNTSQRNGVLLRIFVPIIQDLEVWPYFSIMILNLKVKGIFRDNGGNFLMVHINTIKMDVLLVNIYGQHRDDPNFYTNLNERYEIEAYNQKLKLTLPDILSDWLIISQ